MPTDTKVKMPTKARIGYNGNLNSFYVVLDHEYIDADGERHKYAADGRSGCLFQTSNQAVAALALYESKHGSADNA